MNAQLENWVFESDKPHAELKLIDFGLSTHFSKVRKQHAIYITREDSRLQCPENSILQFANGTVSYLYLCRDNRQVFRWHALTAAFSIWSSILYVTLSIGTCMSMKSNC